MEQIAQSTPYNDVVVRYEEGVRHGLETRGGVFVAKILQVTLRHLHTLRSNSLSAISACWSKQRIAGSYRGTLESGPQCLENREYRPVDRMSARPPLEGSGEVGGARLESEASFTFRTFGQLGRVVHLRHPSGRSGRMSLDGPFLRFPYWLITDANIVGSVSFCQCARAGRHPWS